MFLPKRATVLLATLALVAACGAPDKPAGSTPESAGAVPDTPSAPVSLNILDVAGNLQLTQGMIDEYVKANPKVISKVTYSKATAPELAGKIKAQQDANRVDIDLVLTGVDGLAAGIDQGLWSTFQTNTGKLAGMSDYLPGAQAMQKL